jgi:hypothetical protein
MCAWLRERQVFVRDEDVDAFATQRRKMVDCCLGHRPATNSSRAKGIEELLKEDVLAAGVNEYESRAARTLRHGPISPEPVCCAHERIVGADTIDTR